MRTVLLYFMSNERFGNTTLIRDMGTYTRIRLTVKQPTIRRLPQHKVVGFCPCRQRRVVHLRSRYGKGPHGK